MLVGEMVASFLGFMFQKGYLVVPSYNLTQGATDTGLLFVNAGIIPVKHLMNGSKVLKFASCQGCVRVSGKHNDVNEIGFSDRHHTYFEMLGHFCTKECDPREVLLDALNFLTLQGIPYDRLRLRYHLEAENLRKVVFELSNELGTLTPVEDVSNEWSAGEVGYLGYCVEIDYKFDSIELEIWNLVFVDRDRDEAGNVRDIGTLFLDSGMGVSRLCSVIRHVKGEVEEIDTYLNDDLTGLSRLSSELLSECKPKREMVRVLVDHLRCCVVMLFNNVQPSNVSHGYVLRKLLRRAYSVILYLMPTDVALGNFLENLTEEVLRSHTYNLFNQTLPRFPTYVSLERVVQLLTVEWDNYVKLWRRSERMLSEVDLNDKERLEYLQSTHGIPKLLIDKLTDG